jgi:hypothetical protein
MPPLPKFFRDLLDHAPLPLTATDAWASFEDKPARELKVVLGQALNLLGEGMGHVMVEGGLARSEIPALLTAQTLKENQGFAALLTAPTGQAVNGATMRLVQSALQAVAARIPASPAALRLSGWGADGAWGQETMAALSAFQKAQGLVVDGKVGPQVAQRLIDLLTTAPVPDFWKPVASSEVISAGARRIVAAAQAIVAATPERPYQPVVDGRTYRYYAALFGTPAAENGRLEAPGGVSYGLRLGSPPIWKCNVFAGTCIALAGLPSGAFRWHNTVTTLHFPRAEQFGPRLASKPGWTLVRALDHRDPEDEAQPLVGTRQNAEIAELLGLVRPGDLLFVDHPGEPGNDGGHCRVAVEAAAPHDPDVAPAFAQARQLQAAIERDGLQELGGGREIQFWLLRYTG